MNRGERRRTIRPEIPCAQDWRTDLRDINLAYAKFQPLVRAVENYASAGGRVLLVGHSQGGAVVQIFMYAHRGQDRYRAVTFGSPGARPQHGLFASAADPRITNYAVSDDPFVFLAGIAPRWSAMPCGIRSTD